MAVIDLKNTTIYIEDGYTKTGAVNDAGGGDVADTTLTIDGVTVALAAGTIFTVTGHATEYTVVSSTGGSTPTAIVFTPGLAFTAADNTVLHFGPHRLEVKIGEGNLSYTEKKKYKYTRDRGRLDTVAEDDEETMEVSLEFTWEFLSSSTGDPPTVEEALKKTNNASTWVTSSSDPCEPYAVNIRAINDPPCADIENEIILLRDFRYESLEHSIRDGKVSIKGSCNHTMAELSRV